MFAFLAPLGGLLLTLSASMVGRVLLALGLSYITYSGFNTAVTWLLDKIKADMNSMPMDVISFLGWLWVDKAISMIFSAYAVAMAVKMAGGSVLTKLVRKG